jgi:hypothetical protein
MAADQQGANRYRAQSDMGRGKSSALSQMPKGIHRGHLDAAEGARLRSVFAQYYFSARQYYECGCNQMEQGVFSQLPK